MKNYLKKRSVFMVDKIFPNGEKACAAIATISDKRALADL